MRDEQATPSTRPVPAPIAFEPNEFYEKVLTQRDADRHGYQLRYSEATRRAADAYERAKAKHAGQPGRAA
jgi:hypothetical protein